jgi:hypothetical protein
VQAGDRFNSIRWLREDESLPQFLLKLWLSVLVSLAAYELAKEVFFRHLSKGKAHAIRTPFSSSSTN